MNAPRPGSTLHFAQGGPWMPPPLQVVADADQVFHREEWTKFAPHLRGRGRGHGKAIEQNDLPGRDNLLVAPNTRGTRCPPR